MKTTIPWSRRLLIGVAILLVLVAIVAAVASKHLPIDDWVHAAVEAGDRSGPATWSVALVVVAGAAVAGIPRTPINIGAGIMFEFPVAITLVMIATSISYTITFLISRYAAGDWVKESVQSIPNGRRILDIVEEQGFKLVLLLRMNPFLPGVIKDYGFGLTSISYRSYILGSIFGFLPIACAHVYFGWVGGEAVLHGSKEASTLRTLTLAVGIVISIVLLVVLSWYGRRALSEDSETPSTP